MSTRIGIMIVILCGAATLAADGMRARMTGRIEPTLHAESLYVELRDTLGHAVVDRANVQGDGTFTFDAAPGYYDVRVMSSIHNELITEEYLQVNQMGGELVIRLPQDNGPKPVSGVISAKELQAHVPKKAWQEFVKSQEATKAGRPEEAMRALRRAIDLAPRWRDPRTNLGVELLRMGKPAEAVAELQEAVRIGPPTAMIYTDLGAALAADRRMPEGETAVRQALRLDPADTKAQYLLGHILAFEPGREKEAIENLRRSETAVPAARIVEAQVLMRTGDRGSAAAELREYLNSGDRAHRSQAETMLRSLR